MASLEGGDVMPIGKGNVLIGMGERTNRQAVLQVAQQLFKHKAATRVIAALMPKSRAAMHLDTVFTFCDRDVVTLFREVVDQIRCYSIYPSDADEGARGAPRRQAAAGRRQGSARAQRAARRRNRRQQTTRPSASNGTTATTSSRWSPVSSSRMTATRTPIRCCARRGSK